jgi:hypothetical protein
MPVPVTACKGWNCLMPMPTNPEADGWQDGFCPDCLAEIARDEMREERALTRDELWELGKEEAADSAMRDSKATRDQP